MVKNQQMSVITHNLSPVPIRTSEPAAKPSILEQFSLTFEYDKTLREVKQGVRTRTHKTAKI